MKVTFMEELESRTAFSRKMYCPSCGSHMYIIHHQLSPETPDCWWVECEQCKYETFPSPTREVAIGRWKQGNLC